MTTLTEEDADYQDRIITDPDILVGKPVVQGTRISVELVVDYLAQNPNLDELFADYPRLTIEDVKACLAYAHAVMEEQQEKTGSKAREPSQPAV
ncbi:MAG: DUF433 domain-containing protein [Chloroflexota bacterium]|nr:DUF433 domain-containing protein [Chloroflexota bacterium]